MERLKRLIDRSRGEEGFGLAETLIAVTILVIGLVAVSGLSLASASQARVAKWRAEQATAGQMALEQIQANGYAAATSGIDTVDVGGHDFLVTLTATDITSRVRQVTAVVAAVGDVNARTFTTRLYQPRALPDPLPATGGGGGGGGGGETPPDTTSTPPDTTSTPPDTTSTPPVCTKKC